MTRWLTALPHPALAVEVSQEQIAAVRWSRAGLLDGFAVEPLPPGALVPSPVEANVVNGPILRAAMAKVCSQLRVNDEDVTLLVPDPVIRVFVQHFDDFPRSPEEALPMLRWKLRKSVPFEIDDTVLSYNRQAPHEAGVDIVAVLARMRIIREYEELAESAGMFPGVILSSSLAALALLEEHKPTLLARISGTALTTVIVREGMLCAYRCTELPARAADLTPQMLLDEIFPMTAYYQETWKEGIKSVRIAGLGARLPEFVGLLEDEFHCGVLSPSCSAVAGGRIPDLAKPLVDRELEGLLGWMINRD